MSGAAKSMTEGERTRCAISHGSNSTASIFSREVALADIFQAQVTLVRPSAALRTDRRVLYPWTCSVSSLTQPRQLNVPPMFKRSSCFQIYD